MLYSLFPIPIYPGQLYVIAGSLGLRAEADLSTEESRENQVNLAAQLLAFKMKMLELCY